MSTEIKSPTFPESVADGTIANWVKKEGDQVKQDEVIAEIETDKVVLEVVAPFDGKISKVLKPAGETVLSAELIAEFEKGSISEELEATKVEPLEETKEIEEVAVTKEAKEEVEIENQNEHSSDRNGPAVKKLLKEHDLNPNDIASSGKGGRVTKADVINHLDQPSKEIVQQEIEQHSANQAQANSSERIEERVPMSRLRSTIANRLLTVKQETAMLTTFNEVDLKRIKDLRAKYGKNFEEEHGVKLGFMGFFVLASVQALKKFPLVNASIDGTDIVYHGYQDVGVAVSTERGLVVPVIRDAGNLKITDVERSILDLYPKPSQDGQAPDGLLNENNLGSNS